jgi:hypothetical protein
MTSQKSITFFYPSRITGGVEYCFLRLAEYLSVNSGRKVNYIDYKDGFSFNKLASGPVKLIEYTPNQLNEFEEDTCIIAPPSCIPTLISDFKFSERTNFVFWYLHYFNYLHLFPLSNLYDEESTIVISDCIKLLHREFECSKKGLNFLYEHEALVFTDIENLHINKELFDLDISSHKLIPVPINQVSHEIRSELVSEKEINIGLMGRLSLDKIYPLMHILELATEYSQEKQKKIRVHLIGAGECTSLFEQFNNINNLELIFCGTLVDEVLREYMSTNIDILFSQGTSALEAARLHIPSVLLDISFRPLPKTHKLRWLFETIGYCTGPSAESSLIPCTHTFEDIINFVYEKPGAKIQVGQQCYSYFIENHLIDEVANLLISQTDHSSAFKKDLIFYFSFLEIFKKRFIWTRKILLIIRLLLKVPKWYKLKKIILYLISNKLQLKS